MVEVPEVLWIVTCPARLGCDARADAALKNLWIERIWAEGSGRHCKVRTS
jgi:hypothetical protein